MNKSKELANRLEEVLLNGKWIAHTNIQEQLKKINWKQAIQKIGEHNSIAELTFHINYYVGGILNVFVGGDLEIRDKYSFDMNEINSEEKWAELISSYVANSNSIVEQIANFPKEKWDEPFVKQEYGSYARNIEGLIEHSYYHFGQISLLLKLIHTATNNKWWLHLPATSRYAAYKTCYDSLT